MIERVENPEFIKDCTICGNFMELRSVEAKTWDGDTRAERLLFRCAKCGVTQTQWNILPAESKGPAA